jgi:hypothetical protein
MSYQSSSKSFVLLKSILVILCFFLVSCTGGHSSSNSGSNGGNVDITDIPINLVKPKVVVISTTSVIPTNYGIGAHYIQVANFTGEDLKLSEVKVFDTLYEGINKTRNNQHKSNLHHSVNSLKNVTSNANDNLDVSACVNLQAHGSCTLQFTPPNNNGSTTIQLKYTGINGNHNVYNAGQLINYSPQVSSNNGFLVSNKDISNISSTNDILLSIPFVAEDRYTDLVVKSNVKPIDQYLDCGSEVQRNQHCTALFRLPSDAYTAKITISAKNSLGELIEAVIDINISHENKGNITITGGPVVIRESEPFKELLIMNNGTREVTDLSGVIEGDSSTGANGLGINNVSYSNCNGSGTVLSSLSAGNFCKVIITHPKNNASGFANYVVKAGGVAKASTTVYYLQNKVYQMSVSIDDNSFVGILHKESDFVNITRDVTVKNIGNEPITDLVPELLPSDPSGTVSPYLKINEDILKSTCAESHIVLKQDDTCKYQLVYQPSDIDPFNNIETRFRVSAKKYNAVSESIEFIPQHEVIIYTSTTHSIKNIVISPDVGHDFQIVANNSSFHQESFSISNTDQNHKFTITKVGITGIGWPTGLSLTGITNTNGIGSSIGQDINQESSISLTYQYGPIDSSVIPSSGTLIQNIEGIYEGAGGSNIFKKSFQVGSFSKVDHKVEVTAVGGRFVNDYSNVSTDFDNESSSLTGVLNSGTYAQVQFNYKAIGAGVNNFLINDSNIPFGFTLNKDAGLTTCKTTSGGNSSGATLAKDGSCKVTYDYLNPDKFTGSMFYTLATAGNGSIQAPGFSSIESGVMSTTSSSTELVRLTPHRFATVTVNTQCTRPSILQQNQYSCKATFEAGYATGVIGAVTISPDLTTSSSIFTEGLHSCQISSNNGTCSLSYSVNLENNNEKTISYTYSLDRYAKVYVKDGIKFSKQS